ncbi:unnamed protein product [Owenia fusiformis]|uniref:KAT8 regulatory NSL complex subunit 2 n=1 Tax=Owenia fusiformis TaxID=6347 RepID=A0A8J1U9D4_OWEFU|nr:unnamed protein product [Owenia fusiformis]
MYKSKQQIIRRPKAPIEGLFCNYSHRICMQNRIDGFDYCIKHILEDKDAPYKQCSYMSNKNGKRCHNAAPKSDRKDGYCIEHAKKTAILRQQAARKHKPRETPESLLEELEHHNGSNPSSNPELRRPRSVDTMASRILDYASSGESDTETCLVDQAWRGDGDSDAESIDSEQEDILKHAGIYTAEEVALITRDKLIRLQSLYIDQFKRLQHVMREKRRKCLRGMRIERDRISSVHSSKDDPNQRDKYNKLMAMKKYHKRHGREALLHRQSKQRRMAEGANYKHPSYSKCIHMTDGIKCLQRVVPLSKFCQQHILEDPHQVLFQACGYGQMTCAKPVASCGEEQPRCMLHVPLQEYRSRLPIKDEEPDMLDDVKDMMLQQIDVVTEDNKPIFEDQDDEPLSHLLNLDRHDLMNSSQVANLPDIPVSMNIGQQSLPANNSTNSSGQTFERQISH